MKKAKHLLSLCVLFIFIFLSYASLTAEKHLQSTEAVKTPHYNYVPANPKTKASGITLALIKPSFGKLQENSNCNAYKQFSNHMNEDFKQILTIRGYTFTGPYDKIDEMIWDDKQKSYLALEPVIEITLDPTNLRPIDRSTSHYDIASKRTIPTYAYTFEGFITITGYIKMNFKESESRENIYVSSIELKEKQIMITKSNTYPNSNMNLSQLSQILLLNRDGGIVNPIITALEESYGACLESAFNHLDPGEVGRYVEQAKSARVNRK